MMEHQVRFNLDNFRLEIGRIDRKTARSFIKESIATYGRLVTSNWGLAKTLGIKCSCFTDVKIAAEDAPTAGQIAIPVDCGFGLDFWFKFKDPKTFKVLKKREGINFPCYLILDKGWEKPSKLVKRLNKELAPLVRAYLNNRLYGYSVERYGDAEGTRTNMVFQGFFPSMQEAERAASICFPEFEVRDFD